MLCIGIDRGLVRVFQKDAVCGQIIRGMIGCSGCSGQIWRKVF